MNEKESSFEEKTEKASPPTGLRASNTVKTLQPIPSAPFVWTDDVNPGGPDSIITLDPKASPVAYPSSSPLTVHDDKPKEVVYRPSPEKPKNSYVPEAYAVQHIPSGEFRPVSQVRGPLDARTTGLLLDRVEKLEDQVDALLDRVAKYNIRAAHRI